MQEKYCKPAVQLLTSDIAIVAVIVLAASFLMYTNNFVAQAATAITTVSDRQLAQNDNAVEDTWEEAASITLAENGSWMVLTSFDLNNDTWDMTSAVRLEQDNVIELQSIIYKTRTISTDRFQSHFWMT